MIKLIPHFLEQYNRLGAERRKWIVYCVSAVIVFSLYDVLFDWTFGILHTLFEWLEFGLEELIEHLFHTTRQETQAIVFYLLLLLGAFACYRLALRLKRLCLSLHHKANKEWMIHKTRFSGFWRDQSALYKLKLVLSGSASFMMLAFLAFS